MKFDEVKCKSERSRRIDSSGIILLKQNDITGRYDYDVTRQTCRSSTFFTLTFGKPSVSRKVSNV